MAKTYKSPRWHYLFIPLAICAVYLYPLYIFLQNPERMLKTSSLFALFPLLYLFFLFTPQHERPQTSKPSELMKLALVIATTECVLYLISQGIGTSLLAITTQHSIETKLSITPTWLALWAFFSLFTTASHYFYYHEHKSPLSSAALYNFKSSYLSIFLVRAFSIFTAMGNFILFYLLIAFIMLYLFEMISAPLQLGLNPLLILGFLSITFIASIMISRFSGIIRLPIKLRNIHYLLITSIPTSIVLFRFYDLSIRYAQTPGLIQTLLSQTNPGLPSLNTIELFQYSCFILATPLAASMILCFSKTVSSKKLLILTMLTPAFVFLLCKFMPLVLNLPSTALAILIAISIIICSRQKTATDFFTGCAPLPRQRFIIINKSSRLVLSHIICPTALTTIILNFGLLPISCIILIASISFLIVSLLNLCGFYGRVTRLNSLRGIKNDHNN
jgi:hypothetical protein